MLSKLNPTSIKKDSIVMFSGPLDIDNRIFEKYYLPFVNTAIEANCEIRVGCASGADLSVQSVCKKQKYSNVTVFIPSEEKEKNINFIDNNFKRQVVQGKFKERDYEMQKGVDYIVARVSQYAGGGSGTVANAISVALGIDGYSIVKLIRECSLPFDNDLCKHVKAKEADCLEKVV